MYIVATPIGNLGDFSVRAQNILRQCHSILCEDTRETGKLLKHYGIKNNFISYHKFNEQRKMQSVLTLLHQGNSIALVSDSGTPAISDPGSKLIACCHEQQINVYAVAGCCSISAAVSVSGLAESGFVFIGFLPAKSSERKKTLYSASKSELALVCFEAPHRILATIDDLIAVFGEQKRICLAREMTKKFETVRLDRLANIRPWLHNNAEQQKGEMVVIIEGELCHASSDPLDADNLFDACAQASIGARQSSILVSKITGLSKRECYQRYIDRNTTNNIK